MNSLIHVERKSKAFFARGLFQHPILKVNQKYMVLDIRERQETVSIDKLKEVFVELIPPPQSSSSPEQSRQETNAVPNNSYIAHRQ